MGICLSCFFAPLSPCVPRHVTCYLAQTSLSIVMEAPFITPKHPLLLRQHTATRTSTQSFICSLLVGGTRDVVRVDFLFQDTLRALLAKGHDESPALLPLHGLECRLFRSMHFPLTHQMKARLSFSGTLSKEEVFYLKAVNVGTMSEAALVVWFL